MHAEARGVAHADEVLRDRRQQLRPAVRGRRLGYSPDCVLGFGELVEEYAELLGCDAGKFNPSGCPCDGAYLDFVLFDEDEFQAGATNRYRRTRESVFEKILPDIDLEVVHYCEFEWFNMVDAPDVY